MPAATTTTTRRRRTPLTTVTTVADAPARTLSEAQFQAQVVELATRLNWLVYHTHDSRRSNPGFPDLCMVRGDRVVFAELKSSRGRLRPEQSAWLHALGKANQEVWLWFPVSWPTVEKVLAR